MQPHHQFFTSLKRLEKRLKFENHPPPPPHTVTINTTQQSDSLGTPIYLNSNPTNTNSSNLLESEAPNEFLSTSSSDLPNQNQAEFFNRIVDRAEESSLDCDIELLMQLLGLSSELDEGETEGINDVGCECDDEFYEKIAGVKGPKSVKEIGRLEGWIKYFFKGEKKEPLGLAHLLLGKAAAAFVGDDEGFGGFVFPCTINDFLRNDPPAD